ncbi:hypothetical protein [Okeania sp. SIO1I7]|nr:hypothetical protein [Okeania sp. SIO1I7]
MEICRILLEEGRRKKEEGRGKKEEGRGKNIGWWCIVMVESV